MSRIQVHNKRMEILVVAWMDGIAALIVKKNI